MKKVSGPGHSGSREARVSLALALGRAHPGRSTVKRAVYLDHQATTPTDQRVVEAMLPYFSNHFGNAASVAHSFGWAAAGAVAEARERVRTAIGAVEAAEIIFTSGATESNNLALRGAALAYAKIAGASRGHIITTSIEHDAVLDVADALLREGFSVTRVPVPSNGVVQVAEVERVFRADTILVSVMTANNEVGTLQPIAELGELCSARGAIFHTDAAQAISAVPLDVESWKLDLVSLSAHKFYGPKGVGALYVRRHGRPVRLAPQIVGGGHELGLRAGTLNVPGIVGMGVAAELAVRERKAENQRVRALRDRLLARLSANISGVFVSGDLECRLPGNLNLLIGGVRADALMAALPLLAISSGSACSSLRPEPSHVLDALGLSRADAACSIRLGAGRFTTEEDVDLAAERIERGVARLRNGA